MRMRHYGLSSLCVSALPVLVGRESGSFDAGACTTRWCSDVDAVHSNALHAWTAHAFHPPFVPSIVVGGGEGGSPRLASGSDG